LAVNEAERLPATSAIVLANRGNGPEQCMRIAEERAPASFADIGDGIADGEPVAIAAKYEAVADFSKEAVAARQSAWPASGSAAVPASDRSTNPA
jgi:5-methylphenazine-1-carboxylate 1-monooxygenase